MGYDLHITRKKFWADDEGPVITADEWLAYVAKDPQLRLDPSNNDHHVILDVPSQYPDPWLAWSNGDIYTKNPDAPVITKMLQIASAMDAQVQGDDGEIYPLDQNDEAPIGKPTLPNLQAWPLWKKLVAAFLLGCILLALRILIFGQ